MGVHWGPWFQMYSPYYFIHLRRYDNMALKTLTKIWYLRLKISKNVSFKVQDWLQNPQGVLNQNFGRLKIFDKNGEFFDKKYGDMKRQHFNRNLRRFLSKIRNALCCTVDAYKLMKQPPAGKISLGHFQEVLKRVRQNFKPEPASAPAIEKSWSQHRWQSDILNCTGTSTASPTNIGNWHRWGRGTAPSPARAMLYIM